MARRRRLNLPGVPQHVVQRGNNRQAIFFGAGDYRFYLTTLAELSADHGCAVHAYALMTNHVHLLVTPASADSVSLMMRDLGRQYVQHYVNAKYQRTGTLWEGRFKASLVHAQRYFFACCRYIEMNPVRAGLVAHPAEYAWSSYRHSALGYADPLIDEHPQYTALASDAAQRQRAYRALFEETLDALTLDEIRRSIGESLPLGDDDFRDAVQAASRMPARRGKPGRPRKSTGEMRT